VPNVRVNGVELFHELQGSGETVVLVHGSWGDHANWRTVAPALADSFRVLTYDRRGHSQSERPGDGLRRDDEDDLAGLVLELDLAPAHIVGNSFGASIVLGLAARRPELFRSLVVHEPPLMAIVEDPDVQPLMTEFEGKSAAVIARLKGGDIPGGARQFVEDVAFGPGVWDQLPAEVRQIFTNNALTWVNEDEDPAEATLDTEALRAFSSPALLSEGDQSPPWFPVIIQRLGEILDQSEHHVYRGAGHVPHMTHPEEYVRTVTDFIDAVR
jgi:pimeloyl-ACP methyl ester carboxylesterase